jgi:hypothetical protein
MCPAIPTFRKIRGDSARIVFDQADSAQRTEDRPHDLMRVPLSPPFRARHSRPKASNVSAIKYRAEFMHAFEYTVRPRGTQNGYKLESKRLSYGRHLYRYLEDAISYAKWNSRLNGCKIDILCDQDKVVRTEEFSPQIVTL